MVEKEQAPATDCLSSVAEAVDDVSVITSRLMKLRRRKLIRCCYCATVLLLLLATVIIILTFTVFRFKGPKVKLNNLIITKLELVNGTIPKPGVNVSLTADISVKNPNVASFKYSNTTTSLYYRGALVGEARGPPGRGRSRRTMRMNLTVDLITDQLVSVPNLRADLGSGILVMDSYTVVGGRANIWNIFKRHVTVKMNCTAAFNITSQDLNDLKCKRKVDF